MAEIRAYVERFCLLFGEAPGDVIDAPFTVIRPDSRNPYKQMYVAN